MEWMRLWHSILDSPKVLQMTDSEFTCFVRTMLVASKSEVRGSIKFPTKLLPPLVHMHHNKVYPALKKMEQLGIIRNNGNGIEFINWNEYQPPSDNSTPRVRAFRKRYETVSETVPDTDTESEAETENNKELSTKQKQKHISPMLGEFTNVKLSWGSLKKLENQLGKEKVNELIEALSSHMASTGKVYADHHATIYSWAVRKGWVKRGNKTDGGVNDNVFLRAIREEDERTATRGVDKRTEKVS